MSTAYEQLVALSDVAPDDWPGRADLEPLWLQAANERLAQQRERIPVLGRLADEVGINRIERFDDLIPLLFAHSNYKSYPEGFIAKGRWNLMNKWLDTLSSMRLDERRRRGRQRPGRLGRAPPRRRPEGVRHEWDHRQELLPAADAVRRRSVAEDADPVDPAPAALRRRAAPSDLHLRPEARPPPGRAPLPRRSSRRSGVPAPATSSPRSRCASRRSRAWARCASASPKAPRCRARSPRSSARRRTRQEANAQRLDELMDAAHRAPPRAHVRGGFWAQYWLIVERARARGVAAGEFHPDTVITGGGGTKGAGLPPDYEEQILGFFGISPDHVTGGYGMSEVSAALGEVDGRYRPAPWVIPLMLDDTGEKLIDQEAGQADGRFAFFDVSLEGRWGGVITGDHVTADFATPTRRRSSPEASSATASSRAATTSSPARARSTPT